MKKTKNVLAAIAALVLALPAAVFAQEGTYIDSLGVQDSAYMNQDRLAGAEQASSSGNTGLIAAVVVVVVLVAIFVFLRKKKKK